MAFSGISFFPGATLDISFKYVLFSSLGLSFDHLILHVRKLRLWGSEFDSVKVSGCSWLDLGYKSRWERK